MVKNTGIEGLLSDTSTMERLKVKAKLSYDYSLLFEFLSTYKECYKSLHADTTMKQFMRSFKRDARKALRQIDKRIPVFVELPEIKSVGNGVTQKVDPKTKEPINNELEVHESLPGSNSGYIEYSEE